MKSRVIDATVTSVHKDELCSIAERTSLPNILWEIESSAARGYRSA